MSDAPFLLEVPWREPAEAFESLAEQPFSLLLDGSGRHRLSSWSYIAADPIALIEAGPNEAGDPIAAARAALAPWRRAPRADLPAFSGGLAGLLSYELGARFDRLPRAGPSDWPDIALGLYDCVAAFDLARRRALIVSWGWRADGAVDPQRARDRAHALAAQLAQNTPKDVRASAPWQAPAPIWSRADYATRVARVVRYIHAGDCFQANLSQRLAGALPAGVTPYALYQRLAARSAAPFSAFWHGRGHALASNSPERLVRLTPKDGALHAEARPIKGTRPRGANPAEDTALARELAESLKDRAENLMIVDLLRNDLSRICDAGTVRAPVLFGLESFANVHHLVSVVTGRLRAGADPFDLLAALFPGGSVTGAPKIRAAEIIGELEEEARGAYCGSLAWIGPDGAMDSSILIRTATFDATPAGWPTGWNVSLRAGGGIVADSDPAAEVQESFDKAAAILSAFKQHSAGAAA